ncbi:hypothetical protein OKJ48_09980 [Streptomyces kunmingensis]|uniref:Uncharacterized protein n=1 Tax=Streptomyces kunmingensis TaxID=68225 RepID=A0ABU6C7I7_9ACTN|nr:hypothetical protein [Streptomyces kunmingensis]MEB3960568.1 hypothetical protein [Streptomyces kunmingensis]
MQNVKRPGRPGARQRKQAVVESQPEGVEPGVFDGENAEDTDAYDAYDTFEMYRVLCPDCAQPIALLADEDVLPEHALCASPWNPFGLTVCAGTGRAAAEARPADELTGAQEQDTSLLLTLPQGLDWRTQPFSHVGGPGSRPLQVPLQVSRRAA